MFVCGITRPANWPEEEVLQTWAAANIFDRGNEYWFWGMSCEQQLYYVGQYLQCQVNKNEAACEVIKGIEEKVKVETPTNGTS